VRGRKPSHTHSQAPQRRRPNEQWDCGHHVLHPWRNKGMHAISFNRAGALARRGELAWRWRLLACTGKEGKEGMGGEMVTDQRKVSTCKGRRASGANGYVRAYLAHAQVRCRTHAGIWCSCRPPSSQFVTPKLSRTWISSLWLFVYLVPSSLHPFFYLLHQGFPGSLSLLRPTSLAQEPRGI